MTGRVARVAMFEEVELDLVPKTVYDVDRKFFEEFI
jgi:hypothetical protein